MRVLITGASGMLGTDVCVALENRGHTVIPLSRAKCDVVDPTQVASQFSDCHPHVVINCAAFTKVDACETEADRAYLVNAVGPRNLASACNRAGAALVQISTDYVFPGDKLAPYGEHDPVRPLSVYGASKYAGEQSVRELCPRHFVVRTQWLFGLHGPNFVTTMLRLARDRNLLQVVADQVGAPTYTRDLAQAICVLIGGGNYGTYHLTNQGNCSWWQFAREIFELAGKAGLEVQPTTTEQLGRPAPRPKYSVLDNEAWRLLGYAPLRHYRRALEDYLQELGEGNT